MKRELQNLLFTWPKVYIRDTDIAILVKKSLDARYNLIKRAVKDGLIIQLKKGFYFIKNPYRKEIPNLFEIAQLLYGPSYISLESALSYHQWIPEAVYTITSVSTKRARQFDTSLAVFSFMRVPEELFHLGVERVESKRDIFLMASPWRALADYLYVYRKSWKKLIDISLDLRIESETLRNSDKNILKELAKLYPSTRVRKQLATFLKELS
jgi:hypothetical protein